MLTCLRKYWTTKDEEYLQKSLENIGEQFEKKEYKIRQMIAHGNDARPPKKKQHRQ